jgi:CBS domain-containing protein
VAQRLDPAKTSAADVMSAPVRTVRGALSTSAALDIMHGGRFRHLPVVDGAGDVIGMVSVRDLLRQRIGELDLQNSELLGFLAADAPGG